MSVLESKHLLCNSSEASNSLVAKVLLELGGADINFQNPEGGTALIYAAKVRSCQPCHFFR